MLNVGYIEGLMVS